MGNSASMYSTSGLDKIAVSRVGGAISTRPSEADWSGFRVVLLYFSKAAKSKHQ